MHSFDGTPSFANRLRAVCPMECAPTRVMRKSVVPAPTGAATKRWRGALDVAGSLSAVPFDQACQLIAAGGKTGLLLLFLDKRRGGVFFLEGEVVAVDFGPWKDVEAFRVLSRERSGHFDFLPGVRAKVTRMSMPVTRLLLDAHRLSDEEDSRSIRA